MSGPVQPRMASLVDLLLCGALNESDIETDGRVSEGVRRRAEQEWLHLLPLPSSSRHVRPRTAPSTPRAPSPVVNASRTRSTCHLTDKEAARPAEALALDVCCVCYAHKRDHMFVSCFHLCVCAWCAQRLAHCPMCRTESLAHRVYF